MSSDYLGEFEHLVLLAVLQTGPHAYGVPIRDEIHRRARRDVSFGAVYSTLRRLEAKGLVVSERGNPLPVPGGRARKIVRLTQAGLKAVRASQARIASMSEGLAELA